MKNEREKLCRNEIEEDCGRFCTTNMKSKAQYKLDLRHQL